MNAQSQAIIGAIVREALSSGSGITQNNITINVYEAPEQKQLPLSNMDVTALRLLLGVPLTHKSDRNDSEYFNIGR